MDSIKKEIQFIVCEILKDVNVKDTDSLFEKGVDSMNMLFILNKIENAFDVRIPDEELLISNFENINQMTELVIKLKENIE